MREHAPEGLAAVAVASELSTDILAAVLEGLRCPPDGGRLTWRPGAASGEALSLAGAAWEVGQARITYEAAEQRRTSGRGGGGGKGPDQGEHGPAKRVPDTEPAT